MTEPPSPLTMLFSRHTKRTDDLVPTIESAFKETGVHLITVPIDYIENTRVLLEELQGRVPEIA